MARWFTIKSFARQAGLSVERAQFFIEGKEGFVRKKLVRRVGLGRYAVTEKGRQVADDVGELREPASDLARMARKRRRS